MSRSSLVLLHILFFRCLFYGGRICRRRLHRSVRLPGHVDEQSGHCVIPSIISLQTRTRQVT